MRSSFLLCFALIVVVVSAAEDFASRKIDNVEVPTASNIYQGSFFTRRDHTRPQQRDLALLVSICGYETKNWIIKIYTRRAAISRKFGLLSTGWSFLHLPKRWR